VAESQDQFIYSQQSLNALKRSLSGKRMETYLEFGQRKPSIQ
jgi:hypothetical protein